jgi:hypothetical protein
MPLYSYGPRVSENDIGFVRNNQNKIPIDYDRQFIGASPCHSIPMDPEYPKMPLVLCEIIKIKFPLVTIGDTSTPIVRPLNAKPAPFAAVVFLWTRSIQKCHGLVWNKQNKITIGYDRGCISFDQTTPNVESDGSHCGCIPMDPKYPKIPSVYCGIERIKFCFVTAGDASDAIDRPLSSKWGGSHCRCIPMDPEYPKMPLVLCEIIKVKFPLVKIGNASARSRHP